MEASPMPVTWAQVKQLLEAALNQDHANRSVFLRQACGSNETLRAEVESLLAANEDAASLLEKPSWWDSGLEWLQAESADPLVNRRVGAYRVLRRIARGGMADVYLGIRADRLYRKFVAIKLLKPGLDNEEVRRRYHTELETLAVLDHPNIVKLLDGGTTEDGKPYLVMDYIQGVRIDEYCDRHRFSVSERIELVRTVCAAMQHAHQNLIVHSDLKAGNILVTADGAPKLLDFGIAMLLKAGLSAMAGLTAPGRRAMAADSASPEQIRGEPITTASDVYALGVLLYRLLTGHGPFRLKTGGAVELERAICERDPEMPSEAMSRVEEVVYPDGLPHTLSAETVSHTRDGTPEKLRRRLHGELDSILMMALRKEPQRRYTSVDQFSEDLRRHQAGLPVIACQDTWRYRAGKFMRRHRMGVAAAALVLFSLVGGIAATLWQARVTGAQRAKAERRFNELRQLAGSVLRDFDDAIRAGPTPARKKLVATALVYLNRLAEEAGDDVSLRQEMVDGYLRVGDVQGNVYGPSLGDTDGARKSYREALRIAEELYAANPQAPRVHRDVGRANQKLGELLAFGGDETQALKLYRRAMDIFRAMAGADPANLEAKRDMAALWGKIGFIQFSLGDHDGAQESYEHCLETGRQVFASDPNSRDARLFLAGVDEKTGRLLERSGDLAEGLRKIRQSFETHEELLSADPGNKTLRRTILAQRIVLGDALTHAGKTAEAVAMYRQAVEGIEALAREDPENHQYQRDLSLALAFWANTLSAPGDRAQARLLADRSLGFLKKLAEPTEASSYDHRNYAWTLLRTPFADLKKPAEALRHALKAVDRTNGTSPAALDTLALAYEANNEIEQALACERKAIDLLPPGGSHDREEIEANLKRLEAKLARK